jgi:hypothetical protein
MGGKTLKKGVKMAKNRLFSPFFAQKFGKFDYFYYLCIV